MAFLTEATPANEFSSMKDPLPSKTTLLPLSITPDTASRDLRTFALRRRSLLPNTTRFSNLGRSSSPTDLASNSLVPPIGRAPSYQSDCGETSFLDGSIEVLRGLLDVLPILVAIVHVVRGKHLQRSPYAGELVPWSWLRLSEQLS